MSKNEVNILSIFVRDLANLWTNEIFENCHDLTHVFYLADSGFQRYSVKRNSCLNLQNDENVEICLLDQEFNHRCRDFYIRGMLYYKTSDRAELLIRGDSVETLIRVPKYSCRNLTSVFRRDTSNSYYSSITDKCDRIEFGPSGKSTVYFYDGNAHYFSEKFWRSYETGKFPTTFNLGNQFEFASNPQPNYCSFKVENSDSNQSVDYILTVDNKSWLIFRTSTNPLPDGLYKELVLFKGKFSKWGFFFLGN